MNDFRARFHRPLTAPSPFRNASGVIAPGMVPPPGQTAAQIDPALGSHQPNGSHSQVNGVNGASASNTDSAGDGDGDVDAGEEKDEEAVAKGLELSGSA